MKRKGLFSKVMKNWRAWWISKGLKPLVERMQTHRTVSKVLIVFLLTVSSTVWAHRFYWNPASMTLETAYLFDTLPLSSFVIGELEQGETDFLQLPLPESTEAIIALLAPQACPDFLPELWVVAKTLPETEEAPFDIPEGYKSLRVTNEWQPYKDYIITARLGPNVRLALDETNYYLAVYAGENSGSYIAIKTGRDTIGGTEEGFDALARFVRCEKVATP
jgi:hypothetical protein